MKDEVGPLAKGNEVLIRELEKAVTLLAFEDPSQSPLKDLLDYSERRNTASQLNAAILANQHQVLYSFLPSLWPCLINLKSCLSRRASRGYHCY